MKKLNHNIPCNILLAVLIIVLLVLQFLPSYWTYSYKMADSDDIIDLNPSLQGLIWWPVENQEFIWAEDGLNMPTYKETYFNEHGLKLNKKMHPINDVIGMPVASIAFGALAVVFCIFKLKRFWTAIFAALVGVFGVIGYMTVDIFRMNDMWIYHLAVCVAISVISLFSLGITFTNFIIKAKKEGLI